MSRKLILPTIDNRYMAFNELKEKSALPYIQNRIKHKMPIETVDVEDVKKAISGFNIRIEQSLTVDEVNALVLEIKRFLFGQIEKMSKHERYLHNDKEDKK